jgi:8-oxo-dGTP pyrophosphatase MutT (NUDIX family)
MQLRYDGRLGFFGGMVEDGEDIVTALEREVVEEMGTSSLQGRFKPVSVYEVTIPNGFFKVRKSEPRKSQLPHHHSLSSP